MAASVFRVREVQHLSGIRVVTSPWGTGPGVELANTSRVSISAQSGEVTVTWSVTVVPDAVTARPSAGAVPLRTSIMGPLVTTTSRAALFAPVWVASTEATALPFASAAG